MRAPQHPYSQKLFAALPSPQRRGGELAVIRGQVPPLTAEFDHCRFADRCDFVFARCRAEAPALLEPLPAHLARCHLREAGPAAPRTVTGSSGARRGKRPRAGQVLLEVKDLKVHFPVRRGILRRTVGHVKAVDGVSFELREGRTLALVGESGCGKTTTGKAILQLISPTSGSVRFGGQELTSLTRKEMRPRRSAMQIIFQDPYGSLNPRMRVAEILLEGMRSLAIGADEEERLARVAQLLAEVGLPAGGARPLPARVLRRPAPAHRHRARACGEPEADRVRRADQRARCLGAGADPEPPALAAKPSRPRLPLHHPQHRGRATTSRTKWP